MKKNNNDVKKTYVGCDIGKRKIDLVRLEDGKKPVRFSCSTDNKALPQLFSWLNRTDILSMEAGCFSFSLARQIKEKTGCEVYVMDPRKLSIIHQSLKKTDKEDAMKLALMAQRFDKNELPLVHIPNEDQEDYRNLLCEHEHWVKNRTRTINRLHAIFTRAGITDLRRSALKSHKQRPVLLKKLPSNLIQPAERLHQFIELASQNIESIELQMKDVLKDHKDYTELAFSIPGVGSYNHIRVSGLYWRWNSI